MNIVYKKINYSQISFLIVTTGVALCSFLISPRANAIPARECYQQLSYRATNERDRDRAAYLCLGATSITPAECYQQLSYRATNERSRQRAAYLCQGATSIAPAECYQQLSYRATTERERDRVALLCKY